MRKPVLLLLALVAVLAGCGSEEPASTPSACLQGADAYLEALRAAPGPVSLEGDVSIGDCIVPEQQAGELSTVGAAMVEAATRLNAEVVDDPGGRAALELGYLIGSVEQAAGKTAGVHTDLIRRLNAAADYSEAASGLPPAYERSFDRGYEAARQGG